MESLGTEAVHYVCWVRSANTATMVQHTKVDPKVAPLFTPFKIGRFELEHRMVSTGSRKALAATRCSQLAVDSTVPGSRLCTQLAAS